MKTMSLIVCSLILCAAVIGAQATTYSVTQIGGSGTNGTAINESGQVVGFFSVNSQSHAFMWDRGDLQDLGIVTTASGGYFSRATALNNDGEVVGVSSDGMGIDWRRGAPAEIASLYGPSGINNSGQIVGVTTSSGEEEPFIVGRTGDIRTLQVFGTGSAGGAIAINDRGDVVGSVVHDRFDSSDGPRPVLWTKGVIRDLGAPGFGSAVAINDGGRIVGQWFDTANRSHGFAWDNETMTELLPLDGDTDVNPSAINNRGTIVGWSSGSSLHAVVWDDSTTPLDLGTLVPVEFQPLTGGAIAINNRGQILVTTSGKTSTRKTFLLTPNR